MWRWVARCTPSPQPLRGSSPRAGEQFKVLPRGSPKNKASQRLEIPAGAEQAQNKEVKKTWCSCPLSHQDGTHETKRKRFENCANPETSPCSRYNSPCRGRPACPPKPLTIDYSRFYVRGYRADTPVRPYGSRGSFSREKKKQKNWGSTPPVFDYLP